MSLHRITAGSGYDYLTRQVAALDSTERRHLGLASYYAEKGEVPGQWIGSGLDGIDGLSPGDIVTSEQMLALFGSGHHPLAAQRALDVRSNPNATEKNLLDAIRLGQPFKVYDHDISPYRIEVARRLEAWNASAGRPRDAAVGIEDRARLRTEVGLEWFRRDFGRTPLNQRELAGHIARLSRQKTTAVAGFDLTFSPVKSVSAMWALAEPQLAAAIERAHNAAVSDALRFIETHALFSRTGANGVRQVNVQGLVGAAFTHRDSRAGDPDLHTHVAVANKVQTLDGKWLSIDSRVLHKAITAASETYNTSLEKRLTHSLGVRFAPRPDRDARKRPVREIIGVAPALLERWSVRRHRIVARQAELATAFQRDHARPPTPIEAIALAQQATLETREAKHEPRSLAEQRAAWRLQAEAVLGSADAVEIMVFRALHPTEPEHGRPDREWFDRAARQIVSRVELDRSAWQSWHVRAEALRVVRSLDMSAEYAEQAVDWLTGHVLQHHSIPLSPPEPVNEPAPLRRLNGDSVYTVAGNTLYTSGRILTAEQRILTNAGLRDGRTVPDTAVDLGLLETTANGVELNPGQVALVRAMATSGRRVQLAIAPAGAGKTTAMQALARAWTNSGGDVLGLAPSAVAAAGLAEQTGAHADTISKLAWHLANGDPPAWMRRIGPKTLVVIDEAGMADTLSLDAVITHVLGQGGSVRLIGDDQQLAAIGAGGVLRDIEATHDALHLTELVRFTDPAEGSASLALREGRTEALGFYLDHDRVRVGTPETMLDSVFAGWAEDRAAGRDSVMLAPTRDLVSQLNQRARTHRLAGNDPGVEVKLADGNKASVGDTIITRRNDRRLRLNATDWVKNGDRWTVQAITEDGIRVRHTQTRRHIVLPADYVAEWSELGYASTTHTAQGVTADTCHGLLTGDETRQQAYTMLTRGRHTNTAHLITSGDGDPHSLIHPAVIHPDTAADQLESILARDESPLSASTSLRIANDPRVRLGDAVASYSDAIVFAADHISTPAERRNIQRAAERVLPGLTTADAWPALFARLLTIAADNRDPIAALVRAAEQPILAGRDRAAILSWRLDDIAPLRRRGPLPWLAHVPARLALHPAWARYLTARADLVAQLAEQIRIGAETCEEPPSWLTGSHQRPSTPLVADVEIWRAANRVPDNDSRPTGEQQHGIAALRWQHRLDQRLAHISTPALDEWRPALNTLNPTLSRDPFFAQLAEQLGQLGSAGIDVKGLLTQAMAAGPLPDEHAAAALWWRLSGRVSPAVTEELAPNRHLAAAWLPHLKTMLPDGATDILRDSTWWPALITTIEHAIQAGWTLDRVVALAPTHHTGLADHCQAWLWRLSLAMEPAPDHADEPEPPAINYEVPTTTPVGAPAAFREPAPDEPILDDPEAEASRILAIEALVRQTMGPPEPSASEIRRQLDRLDAWRSCPYSPERLAHINELAAKFYESCLAGSWAHPYLAQRLGQDIAGHPQIRPGYAPHDWSRLVQHLRRQGISDDEMLTVGVATRTRTGKLVDRFRDRLVFPIAHEGRVLGFVGRRNPAQDDDPPHGPKYLNTADTPLFHKGDQLYLIGLPTATPVLVEGPLDAIAIALATGGEHTGVATLGTSLTDRQAAQLLSMTTEPIVATDADTAGKQATERDYWILSAAGLSPRHAALPDRADPASLLADGHGAQLAQALRHAESLGAHLLADQLAKPTDPEALLRAVMTIAAMPPDRWETAASEVAQTAELPSGLVKIALASAVQAWNSDPARAGAAQTHAPTRHQGEAPQNRPPSTRRVRNVGQASGRPR